MKKRAVRHRIDRFRASAVLRLLADGERVGNQGRLARRGRPGVVVFLIDDVRLRLADLRAVQAVAFL